MGDDQNPHCLQADTFRADIPFTRILSPDAKTAVYRKREGELKTVIHWGQRKLLMSEIEFLLMCMPPEDKQCIVIYAGAAPGTHINLLSEMFPSHWFYLIDPAPFSVLPDRKIKIMQEMFTDEIARDIKDSFEDKHVLFVSDVRSTDPNEDTQEDNKEKIQKDMVAQARWHNILQPFKSMLKFRLPWTKGTTRYLSGDIFLPVWGPITTTECRLVVGTFAPEVNYDNTEHERKMYYFNTVTRPAHYRHNVPGQGIDCCYDCRAEIGILRRLLGPRASDADIGVVSESISARLHRTRTLSSPNPDPVLRYDAIRRNQWINGRPAYEED